MYREMCVYMYMYVYIYIYIYTNTQQQQINIQIINNVQLIIQIHFQELNT